MNNTHKFQIWLLVVATAAWARAAQGAVTNTDTAEVFATIQAAIDDSDTTSGDTLVVDPGTYVENVLLTKGVILQGAQAGTDARGRVVGAPNPATESIITAVSGRLIELKAGAAGAVIDGFALSGGTRGIESTSGPLNGVEIRNNHFEGQSSSAVFLNDTGENITIDQNALIGSAASGTVLHLDQDGFDGLYLTRNDILRTGGPAGTGWFVDGNRNIGSSALRDPLISQNVFDGHDAGANVGRFAIENATISLNTFSNNGFDGFQGGPKDCDISKNVFLNNDRAGLRLTGFGGTGDATRGAQGNLISENFFSGNGAGASATGYGDIRFDDQFDGTQATNQVTGNSLLSAVAIFDNETSAEILDCSANWWGANTGPTVASHPTGTGAALSGAGSGSVDFTPWLNDGADGDSDPATGFQGDFSTLQVDDDSPQSGALVRIQEGVNLVTASTVNVLPGTYAGNIVVNGGVVLQSTGGAAVTTIAGAGGCAVTVDGDGVTIDGFTVTNPTGKNGICSTDHSDVEIKNNVVTQVGNTSISGNVHAILIESSGSASADSSNIAITNNEINEIRVGPNYSDSGITVGFSNGSFAVSDLSIQDNTIYDVKANTSAWPVGHGAYGILINHGTGSTGSTEDAVVSGNSIDDLEGLWAHGIGLEGYTPSAVVECNLISNLVDHKLPSDAVGIQVEANIAATTIALHNNSFTNVPVGVQNTTGLNVDAENNFWGDASGPSDQGPGTGAAVYTADIDFDPWLSGPLNVLELSAADCQDDAFPGESGYQIVVELSMSGLCQTVTGFEAFVAYDNGALNFRDDLSSYTGTPFPAHISPILAQADDGVIELDGSAYGAGSGTNNDALLATLVFDVPSGCESETVSFQVGGSFPSELSYQGVPVATSLVNTGMFTADDTAPTIDICPTDNETVECDGAGNSADIDAWRSTFDASDNCVAVTLSDDFSALSDDCGSTGEATVTFTATDACGNSDSSCVATFIVEDTTPPVLNCPEDITIECDTSSLPDVTGTPAYVQDFETDLYGWFDLGGTITRVASGTGGVPSASGSGWHAVTDGAFTRWGGYSSTFPAGGYSTLVDVYLDVSAGLANDTRMDYTSAINTPGGIHRRDFAIAIGFYDSADTVGPGAGTDRFVMSASNNTPGWPKNPARDPYAVGATGWYTIEHHFYDSGSGVLAVDVNLYDSGGTFLHSWTLSDPTDIIGSTVGGNRYGWFLNMGWTLPIDNATLQGGGAFAYDMCDPSPAVTFTDAFTAGACTGSGTIERTWQAEDACGLTTTCTQTITLEDTTDPVIECPADVVVECDASLLPEDLDATESMAFDANPTLSASQAPGVWYTDRYAPAGFVSENFDGDNRLKHSIDASDCKTCRPGGFVTDFYNTQGRKYDLAPGTRRMSIDLYVPAAWETTGRRMAGFWGTGYDAGSTVSWYPIIEFTSTSDGSGVARFRVYNNGVWEDMGLPGGFNYDAWTTLSMELVGSTWVYTVGGLTHTTPAGDSVRIGNVILQGHNTDAPGVTYDIYWDNFAAGGAPLATDNCDPAPALSYDDNTDNLVCNGTGPRLRTWTATDDCGNDATCVQTITVQDTTPPDITGCPADIVVNADAGGCDAVVTWTAPTPGDNCGLDTFVSTHNSGDTFPTGTTLVKYTATDNCGLVTTCGFTVTVNAVNDVDVEVELDGVNVPTTRCIHFQTDNCNAVADVELPFIDHDSNAATPVRFVGTVEVPCGAWTKLCAKDQQHTLWDTSTLTNGGTAYSADTLLSLKGGDTDNDADVDIHDVTWFILQFGHPAEDGGCPWDGTRDADFSNNGGVAAEDYTFLTANWLTFNSCVCTVIRPSSQFEDISGHRLPTSLTRVSSRMTPAEFDRIDLNRDGVFDVDDVARFERDHGFVGTLSRKMRKVGSAASEVVHTPAAVMESQHPDGR